MSETVVINGNEHDVSGAPLHQTLLGFLRESGYIGTKCGCDEGDCGACTLLVLQPEGEAPRAINSCLALLRSMAGKEVVTAEGLGRDTGLHPGQDNMVKLSGSQCGYCTPGIVCSLAEASARGVASDPAAVADQLCGNLCRCTGYRPIREAALATPAVALPACEAKGVEPSSDGFFRPTTVREALHLKRENPDAEFLAGATETAVLMNKRGDRPEALIALEGIAELRAVTSSDTCWSLGAGAVLTDIEAALAGEFPAFDQMLRLFASRQIRHRATLGGNLVTASPIGDSAPVLLALDAAVVLESLDGKRTVRLDEFFTGYRQTLLGENELMVAIELPRSLSGETSFAKVSKRREMDISTVSAAIRIAVDERNVITEARLAFGGVAATPARAEKTEAMLVGMAIGDAGAPGVLASLDSEFTPMDDHRGSAAFRSVLIRDLYLKQLAGDRSEIPDFVVSEPWPDNPKATAHESAVGHVSGASRYVEDDSLLSGGALRVWPVRSSIARGTIAKLDVSAAMEAPGVSAVLTAGDVPSSNNTGPARHDEPLFAERDIAFHGQLVAAVVGTSLEACRLAAAKIVLEVEPLEPLLGIRAAIEAGSFHTDPHVLARGDLDNGMSASAHRIEGTLDIGGQEHFYLETHAASARPDGDGGVLVRSSTQHPSEVQTIVAEVLGSPRNEVVVEAPRMGGGFGGKETQGNAWAALCAIAALKTGREVVVQLDRDDDMEWSGKRHPFLAEYKVGFDDEGKLLAAEIDLVSDGGWSLDLSLPVCDRGLFHLDNAYYIPNVRFSGRVAKTNVTSHTAFRGFGGPQGMIVIEEVLGQIAARLGLPPEEVRQRNLYHGSGETNTTHYGEEVEDNRLPRIWSALIEESNFATRKAETDAWNAAHPHRKRGLAITPVKFGISFTLKHYNQAGALVLIYADGSVQVNHGGTEMGQGLHTKIRGVAMRELGLEAGSVRLMHTRTDKVPNTSATAASSGSDLNGMAVADACRQLKERLLPLAAELLGCAEGEVGFDEGRVFSPEKSVPFSELTERAYERRVQLSAAGFYKTPDLVWDWDVGKGKPFHYFAFGAAVSEVEIDGFTGMHHVRRVDVLHDVGDSLNPAVDRGQIEGGFVQGMGWLTSEELKWSDGGQLLTHSASTYAIPAFSDAPMDFRVSLLEDAEQARTIHGSKAVGEPPLMLAFSVREAIREALASFGRNPASEEFASPLTCERVKGIIGPIDPVSPGAAR